MGKKLDEIAKNGTFEGDNVPKLTRIIYPWSGIFRDACYTLIGTFLMQYAVTAGVLSSDPDVFTKQFGIITTAMIICLLWDGLNDPIMGFIIEKVHFKTGKFRPWIAIGAIGNALIVALMFLLPLMMVGGSGWGYVAFMIVMYILWDLAFTMNDIGYWSMLPSLSNDSKTRSKLTTNVAVAASIGTAFMTLGMYVLPGLIPFSTAQIYAGAATLVAILFLASQLAIYFLCKEKKRDPKQEEASEKSTLLDLFKIVIKNKQLLVVVLALLLFQFGEFILTGIGQNYFYMLFGYGGNRGGLVTTAILAVYILSTIIAQLFYPLLRKKFTNKQILTMMGLTILIGYIAFLLIAFPLFKETPLAYNQITYNSDGSINPLWIAGGSMWMYYVFAFFFFGATGVFYLAILVLFQNAIDYQEWKYGERKESIAFAWRPLDVKLASGLNRGLQFIVYAATGTTAFINAISNAEGKYNAQHNAGYNETLAATLRDTTIESARGSIKSSQLAIFGIIIITVILVCFGAAYALLMFGFKIDDKMEEQIVAELAKRHKEDEKEVDEKDVVEPVAEPVTEETPTEETKSE
jgi:Na+/melibiose symporter-like transporter